MTEVEIVSFAGGTAALFSTARPSDRPKAGPNQDAAVLHPINDDAGVLAVADGVGGAPAGARAAELAVAQLRDALARAINGSGSIREGVLNGFEKGNSAILELGVGAGSTLAVVEIVNGELRPYHVGDSAILVAGQRRKQKLLTVSHSPVGYAVEAGVLDPKEALHHEDLELVLNLVGSTDMRIEVGPSLKLAQRDTVVVASDGLFDNLHIEEIVDLVRTGPLLDAANNLMKACLGRIHDPQAGQPSKSDDVTFIVYRP